MDNVTYNNFYKGAITEYSYKEIDGRDFMSITQNGNVVYLQIDQIFRLAEKGQEWLAEWEKKKIDEEC